MELLTVPSYRVAASRVGDCIERMPGPDSAAAGAGKYLRTQTWQSGKDMKRTRIIVVACAVVAGVLVVTLFFTLRSSHKEISGVIAPLICVHHIPSRHEGVVMGPYWVYDDSWATRTCIRPEGVGFKVETNARPDDDEVVAYPDIRYGSAYGFTTPGSDLPVPISRIGSPLLTATADGNAGGIWIADFDAWFFPTSDVAHHGTAEMVIILRYPAHSMTGGPEVTVDGRKWWLEEWTTCERDPGGKCTLSWPLIRFAIASRVDHITISFDAFVTAAVRRGLLPGHDWLGSMSFGFENWSGGRGEYASMQVQRVTPPPPATAYVVNFLAGTVTPIQAATDKAGRAIKVGKHPDAIAVTPDGKTVFVANQGSDTVIPIQAATDEPGRAIKVGKHPDAIAVTPDGKTVFVANQGSDTVIPIQAATDKAGRAIKVGKHPDAIAVTPDGKTAYVLASNTVVPIRIASGTALKAIKVGHRPDAIAITPDGKTAYVANLSSDTVTPIRTATNTALKAIKVGHRPDAIAITPDGKTAYVADSYGNHVTPIDTSTNSALKAIKVGVGPASIVITPDGKTAYVVSSGSGTVTPISTATDKPGSAIKVGRFPVGIAVTPDGKTAYITNLDSGTVTPIDTTTGTALKGIKVGMRRGRGGPRLIAITP